MCFSQRLPAAHHPEGILICTLLSWMKESPHLTWVNLEATTHSAPAWSRTRHLARADPSLGLRRVTWEQERDSEPWTLPSMQGPQNQPLIGFLVPVQGPT